MTESPETKLARLPAQSWFESGVGRFLLVLEQAQVGRVLPDLFGYHIVQIGAPGAPGLLDTSRIGHRLLVRLPGGAATVATLTCSAEALPFPADGIDVVVLPHVLEFAPSPHQVLREAERVLIGEGHLLVLGFNPWSLWGLWHLFLGWREEPPWCGHYYGLPRLRDWLTLLDFDVVRVERFFFRPPLHNPGLMQRLEILEKLGRYAWPFLAGAHLVVAKKRVAPLTPSRMRWGARRSMIAAGVAEPSMREFPVE